MEGIQNLKERMEQLGEEEGWESKGDRIDIDEFYPDFEKDLDKSVVGLFIDNITLPRKKDGKPLHFAIILTPENKYIAIRHYDLVKNGIKNVKKGDGLRVTYLGQQDKKKEDGWYHNFKVEVKKFEADPLPEEPQTPTLADNDDPEAQNTIENYITIIKENDPYIPEKDLDQAIVRMAETDPDLSDVERSRVKAQVAVNIKKRK